MTTTSQFLTEDEYLAAVEDMRARLVEIARGNTVSPDDAEDAVQEAVMARLKILDQYNPELSSLTTWVAQEVISRAINTNRYHGRQLRLTGDPPGFPDDVEHTENTRRAQAKPKPKQECGYDPGYDLKLSVQQALAKLPDKERAAATAVLLEGATIAEYAEQLGVTTRTVDRLIADAKSKLKDLLKDYRV